MKPAIRREDRDIRITLASLLQELTIAAMDLFPPGSSLDSFLERVAERLGCSVVLCLEYLSTTNRLCLMADSGLSFSSRKLKSVFVAQNLQAQHLVKENLIESGTVISFPEIQIENQTRWCFELTDELAWGSKRCVFVLLVFPDTLVPDHRYYGMIERLLNSFKAALVHREVYANMSFQKALLESQNEAAVEGIVVFSSGGSVISFNRKFVEIWNFKTQIRDRPVEAMLTDISVQLEEPSSFVKWVRHSFHRSEAMTCEEIILKDGRVFECCSAPIKQSAGPNYGRGLYFRDITGPKRAEQKLMQLLAYEQELRCKAEQSDRRNMLLAEISKRLANAAFDQEQMQQTLADLVVPEIADYAFVYEYQNHDRRARVKAVGHLDRIHASQLKDSLQSCRPVLTSAGPQPEINPINLGDACLKSVLERIKSDSVMIAPMKTHDKILGFVCFVGLAPREDYDSKDLAFAEEIASRAALAAENARLYSEARQAVRERESFLAVASHELRTPVTSIRAIAQLLIAKLKSDSIPSPQQIQHVARLLDEQSIRLTRLVEQLLDVTQIRLGKLKLAPKIVDIVELVTAIVDAARAKNPSFEFNVRAPKSFKAVVDPIRLEQVIINLIENSIRHAAEGKRVDLDISEPDEIFRISVRDYGRGIPESQKSRLFQRGASSGYTSGLGLGLYISKEIMELHGGEIHVEKPSGGGVRFVITAPSRAVSTKAEIAA